MEAIGFLEKASKNRLFRKSQQKQDF